jgi:hypothetical protein
LVFLWRFPGTSRAKSINEKASKKKTSDPEIQSKDNLLEKLRIIETEESKIYFDAGMDTLNQSAIRKLESFSSHLIDISRDLVSWELKIVGSADSSGDSGRNKFLAQSRANKVKSHLTGLLLRAFPESRIQDWNSRMIIGSLSPKPGFFPEEREKLRSVSLHISILKFDCQKFPMDRSSK